MKQVAVRNIRLCTKDCLCLYVCPTGATDTENSIIDTTKCTGCKSCADACPNGAISMVPLSYPAQQKKQDDVIAILNAVSYRKMQAETIANQIDCQAGNQTVQPLMQAIARSSRLIAEDLIREAGYMLPQSANAQDFLQGLLTNPPDDFPTEIVTELLTRIPCKETKEGIIQ